MKSCMIRGTTCRLSRAVELCPSATEPVAPTALERRYSRCNGLNSQNSGHKSVFDRIKSAQSRPDHRGKEHGAAHYNGTRNLARHLGWPQGQTLARSEATSKSEIWGGIRPCSFFRSMCTYTRKYTYAHITLEAHHTCMSQEAQKRGA